MVDNKIITKRKRKKISISLRLQILERDKYTCQCCGKTHKDEEMIVYHKKDRLEIDHYKPFINGGSCSIDNFYVLCKKCNLEKSDSDFRYPIDNKDILNESLSEKYSLVNVFLKKTCESHSYGNNRKREMIRPAHPKIAQIIGSFSNRISHPKSSKIVTLTKGDIFINNDDGDLRLKYYNMMEEICEHFCKRLKELKIPTKIQREIYKKSSNVYQFDCLVNEYRINMGYKKIVESDIK